MIHAARHSMTASLFVTLGLRNAANSLCGVTFSPAT